MDRFYFLLTYSSLTLLTIKSIVPYRIIPNQIRSVHCGELYDGSASNYPRNYSCNSPGAASISSVASSRTGLTKSGRVKNRPHICQSCGSNFTQKIHLVTVVDNFLTFKAGLSLSIPVSPLSPLNFEKRRKFEIIFEKLQFSQYLRTGSRFLLFLVIVLSGNKVNIQS